MDVIPGELLPLSILPHAATYYCSVCSTIPQDAVQSLIDVSGVGTGGARDWQRGHCPPPPPISNQA